MKSELIKPTAALLVFALASAILIGITYGITQEPLAERRAQAAASAVLDLLPNTHSTTYYYIDYPDSTLTHMTRSYDTSGSFIGYIFSATPSGYGGEINMMVAFSSEGIIQGMQVISHSETPGFGAFISEDWFGEQFAGRSGLLATARGATGPQEIDIVSNATLSVSAIVRGINDASIYLGLATHEELAAIEAAPAQHLYFPDIGELLPGSYRTEHVTMVVSFDENDTVNGYIFYVSPQGYGGPIDIAVAFDMHGVIQGLRILDHRETFGFGAIIGEDWFAEQFIGRSGELAAVNRASEPHEIDIVSMATISVEAVVQGVNDAVAFMGGLAPDLSLFEEAEED